MCIERKSKKYLKHVNKEIGKRDFFIWRIYDYTKIRPKRLSWKRI